MEQMKVSSIIKSYPNAFVVVYVIKRSGTGAVELAQVYGVCSTKAEAFTQQAMYEMLGVKTIIIPTFEETDSALHIEISDDTYNVEPLLTPNEYARIYRQYFDL